MTLRREEENIMKRIINAKGTEFGHAYCDSIDEQLEKWENEPIEFEYEMEVAEAAEDKILKRDAAYKHICEYLWNEMERLRNEVLNAEKNYKNAVEISRPQNVIDLLREQSEFFFDRFNVARYAYLEWFKECVSRGIY